MTGAELSLLIKVYDEFSAPLQQAQTAIGAAGDAISQLAAKAGGVGGDFHKMAASTDEASQKAREGGGIWAEFGKQLADVGKIALGLDLSRVSMSIAEHVANAMESVVTLGEATHKLQQEIGGTAEQVSGDLAVFERWGVSNEQAAVSLGILSKNILTFEDSSQKAQSKATGFAGAVDSLGLSLTNSAGQILPMNDLLLQVADRFQAMPDGVQKTADAMALFGRRGRDMIPMLNQGSEGIKVAMETAKQYGLVLSQDNVEAVYKFGQAQRDLSEVMKGFAVQVGVLVLPLLISLVQGVTSAAETFNTTFLPIIRAVVDYVSNTFGPYISAAVDLVGQGFNALAGIVAGALNSVLSIVASVGQAIADALSWVNPFAEHSPSLVSQVADGMTAIQGSYDGVTSIALPLATAGESVKQFARDSITTLKGMASDVKDQLASVTDALKDATTQLSQWGKTPVEGSKAFADQLDAITTKEDQVKLRIDQIKLGNDITPQVAALNEQLKQLSFNAPQSPLGGNKQQMKDFHAAARSHQDAVRGINEQLNALKTGGAQGDIKALQDQLAQLGLQADTVKLTEKLQLDPLRKQIKDVINPQLAEKPFQAIIDGAKAAKATIETLTPQQTMLQDKLKVMQQQLSDMTAAAAGGKGKGAGSTANPVAATFKDINKTLDDSKMKLAEWGAKVTEARDHITQFADKIIGPVASAFEALKGYLDPNNKIDLMGNLFGHDLGAGIDDIVRGYESAFAGVVDIVAKVKAALSGGSLDLGAILKDALNYPVSILAGWGGFAVGIAKTIIDGLPTIVAALGQIGTAVLTWIAGEVAPITAQVTTWAKAFTDWATPALANARAQIPIIGAAILAAIVAETAPIRAKVAAWATAFGDWVGPAVTQFLKDWPQLFNGILDHIAAAVAPLLLQLGKWAVAFGAWVVPAVTQFLKDWPALENSLLDRIGAAVGPILLQLGKWALAFVAWIVPLIPSILLALGQVALAIGIFIVETVGVLALKLAQWGLEFIKWVAPQIPGLLKELATLITQVNDWINQQAASIAKAAFSWGVQLIKGFLDGLVGLGAQLVAFLTSELAHAQINLGAVHLNVGFAGKSAGGDTTTPNIGAGPGSTSSASNGMGKVPTTVTNNVPIVQNFYGNHDPAAVGAASQQGAYSGVLRARGLN